MKKKYFFVLFYCVIIICAAGCENNRSTDRTAKQQNTVEDVIKSEMAKTDMIQENKNIPDNMTAEKDDDNISGSLQKIDVDLTAMSSTIVYSEVYNMMYEPNEYIGKTIKMKGVFKTYHDE
ncbi:MAG: hypothetical protein IJ736_05845, partial [Firmicutes bacterium]|nr:hypothetical protein [Bacillota bacterium]